MAAVANDTDVCITHIESPTKFFVVASDKVPLLDLIWREIEKASPASSCPSATSNNNWLPSADILNAFAPCIAQWLGRWYRARVVCRRPDGKFDVEYIDYGNIETVEPTQVKKRPLTPLINCTERLAWPCRLSGDATRMDKKRFEELCVSNGGRFAMKIDETDDETGQQIVTLFFDDAVGHKRSINKILANAVVCQNVESGVTVESRTRNELPTVAIIDRTFIGPLGGRMKKPTKKKSATVDAASVNLSTNRDESNQAKYPLIDLAEDRQQASLVSGSAVNAGKASSVRTMARFVSDLDAILNGPADDADSEEEGDNCESTAKNRVGGRKPGNAAVPSLSRRGHFQTWSVSSDSGQSASAEDESLKALKEKWSYMLSLRYGNLKAPAPGTLSAEQQVTITRIISPTSFYAQTMQQKYGLRRLELSMADEFRPNQTSIPAPLVKPDACCAVFSDVSKTWRRGRVVTVFRDADVASGKLIADIYLVDTGFERSFPVEALKPINEHFTTYLPLVFHVKLTHPFFENITWKPEDTETFRIMVENRTLIMKFTTNEPPLPEVELVDMSHNCTICSFREKKCTVNERMIRWIQSNGGLGSRL